MSIRESAPSIGGLGAGWHAVALLDSDLVHDDVASRLRAVPEARKSLIATHKFTYIT
jgi:hypothetical protein